MSPSLLNAPPFASGHMIERSKSQSPNAGKGVQEFQNQQLDFMSKLTISGRTTSPTQQIAASPTTKESPRVKSFRRKFPSASKLSGDASPEVKSSISPVALEDKLDQVLEAEVEGKAPDSQLTVPSQAASIAKMWLDQARYAIQYYQSWEETWASWTPEQQQEYYSQYYAAQGYDMNQYGYGWEQEGQQDYFDVYDYGYDWGGGGGDNYDWAEQGDQDQRGWYVEGGEGAGGGADEVKDDNWEGVQIYEDTEMEAATCRIEDIDEGWNTNRSGESKDVKGEVDRPTSPLSDGGDTVSSALPPVPTIVRAAATFQPADATELEFATDDIIAVTNEDASGWWYGFVIPQGFDLYGEGAEMPKEGGEIKGGWFPMTFVDRID